MKQPFSHRELATFIAVLVFALCAARAEDPTMMRRDATRPTTLPAAVADGAMGKLSIFCPQGVLSDVRHGSEIYMLVRGGRVVAVEAEPVETGPADKLLRLVTAGVDVLPAPNGDSAGTIFPLADGTVSDVLSDEFEREFRGLGFCVIVRHAEKLFGREVYSLYSHMKDEPKVAVGDAVIAGQTTLGYAPDGDPGLGRRLHLEVRFFRDRYLPAWKAPSGVRGRNFVARDFDRDFLDPRRFFAVLHPDIPALTAALKDREPVVREEAAACLGLIGRDATPARAALTEATQDAQQEVADAAATALVKTYGTDPNSAKDVAALLKHSSDFVRGAAARQIGEFGPPARDIAVPALIDALSDADHGVRAYVAGALERFAPDAREVMAPLRKVLREDKFPEALFAAARALSSFGAEAKDAIPEIIAMLPQLDAPLRAEVIRCLPSFGPAARSAIPAMQELKKDVDPQIRAAAEEAVAALTKADPPKE